jgi:hypothetical protein
MRAFYGQDLHWKKQFRGLRVEFDCDCLEPATLMAALSAGQYTAQKDGLPLPSSGLLPGRFWKSSATCRRARIASGVF